MMCGFFVGPRRYVEDGHWIRDTALTKNDNNNMYTENRNTITHAHHTFSDQLPRQQIKTVHHIIPFKGPYNPKPWFVQPSIWLSSKALGLLSGAQDLSTQKSTRCRV